MQGCRGNYKGKKRTTVWMRTILSNSHDIEWCQFSDHMVDRQGPM